MGGGVCMGGGGGGGRGEGGGLEYVNFCTMNPNLKYFLEGEGARVSDLFYKDS